MKFSTSFLLLASAISATATTIRSASAKASLLAKSRRLDQQGDDAQNQFQFLLNYKIKLIGCAAGETYTNPEDGTTEYASVIYRLCPNDQCDDSSATGCKSGYGDYVVGINSFVENWLQDKRDDMQADDNFKIEEYGNCKEYMADNDDGNQNQQQYYVGPTCNGNGIALGFFSDNTCTTVPDVTFETISNGWTLPYSSGLVGTGCEGCSGYNDNGEVELSEMCQALYQVSGRCETKMTSTGSSGADESGCEYIASLAPAQKGHAGAAVGWAILALFIVGAAGYGYTKWWVSKKQGSSIASGGVLN